MGEAQQIMNQPTSALSADKQPWPKVVAALQRAEGALAPPGVELGADGYTPMNPSLYNKDQRDAIAAFQASQRSFLSSLLRR
jgi:hypothetical protein